MAHDTPLPATRDLPPEDWHRLATFWPFTDGLPDPRFSRIIVAEVGGPGGEIRAFWTVMTCVHVEPVWIHPDDRKRPGLVRRLWTAVHTLLLDLDVRVAFACILDKDAAQNVPLALRLGFQKLRGDLYAIYPHPGDGPPQE